MRAMGDGLEAYVAPARDAKSDLLASQLVGQLRHCGKRCRVKARCPHALREYVHRQLPHWPAMKEWIFCRGSPASVRSRRPPTAVDAWPPSSRPRLLPSLRPQRRRVALLRLKLGAQPRCRRLHCRRGRALIGNFRMPGWPPQRGWGTACCVRAIAPQARACLWNPPAGSGRRGAHEPSTCIAERANQAGTLADSPARRMRFHAASSWKTRAVAPST